MKIIIVLSGIIGLSIVVFLMTAGEVWRDKRKAKAANEMYETDLKNIILRNTGIAIFLIVPGLILLLGPYL